MDLAETGENPFDFCQLSRTVSKQFLCLFYLFHGSRTVGVDTNATVDEGRSDMSDASFLRRIKLALDAQKILFALIQGIDLGF